MRVLRDSSIAPPETEYLVAFSPCIAPLASGARRMVRVLAKTPHQAKQICRRRYPQARFLQVFSKPVF